MADYEGTLGFDDRRVDSTIVYITPNFGGFQFAAATVPGAASTVARERTQPLCTKGHLEKFKVSLQNKEAPLCPCA